MSEIKTIKGRVEFIYVPIAGLTPMDMVGLYRKHDVSPTKKNLLKLSEITEEQASLLVEPLTYASSMYDDLDTDVIKPNKTAKESLFSLLKTNGCCIKEWIEKPNINDFKSIPFCESGECKAYFDEVSVWEKAPDDYLLIIKQ